jgi:hypothetical protein
MGSYHTELGTIMLEFLTELPATKKNRQKTVCNNTVVRAVYSENQNIVYCELHGNKIVSLYNLDGVLFVTLALCGYPTLTTRNRINSILGGLNALFYVRRYKGNDYIESNDVDNPMQIAMFSRGVYTLELRSGKYLTEEE